MIGKRGRPAACFALADAARRLEAVHLGHLHVHQHEVERLVRRGRRDRLAAVGGQRHLVAPLRSRPIASFWLTRLSSASRMRSGRGERRGAVALGQAAAAAGLQTPSDSAIES